ncbi:LEVG family PEP-CTERM protein [Nostocaceae cyanobacterium CENA369]|uniref:LEVG family PEP-CTERM protein n=1 Tax=Dendronalium phyllosphericum CENA369 TaxID=1725256 RepID=A0A8J7I668_9NOST|nr:LEVG family PEP-CTERM protein [Dendronalium phyllosphericum]MBH8576736.1 LEVG family PEP-CTERM protein [Dendronalium phyllosphericum CENA369]
MKKFTMLATTFVASTLSLSFVNNISQAEAASLVPQQEGEIALTNVACFTGNCISTAPLGYTISSEVYSPNYKPSLLFSDKSSTVNNYSNQSNPGIVIKFTTPDAGTNPTAIENWFRPVAIKPNGNVVENGQLEVGQFKFNFAQTISELELSFFDIEQSGTAILNVNGVAVNQGILAASDSNIKKVKLTNVDSFVIRLGSIGGNFKYGDGVLLKASTPEPASTLSLGALVLGSMFGLRKSKKSSPAA